MRAVRPLIVTLVVVFAVSDGATDLAAASLTVNTTADASDSSPGDGSCETGAGNGVCTLRAAMEEANALAGTDTISFNIPVGNDPGCDAGSGVCAITPGTDLPAISNAVIDGYTQPGASPNTNGPAQGTNAALKIELSGPGGGIGLHTIESSAVRGLAVNQFSRALIVGDVGSNSIQGNFIGTDATGTVAKENNEAVDVVGAGNIIGGVNPEDRNLITDGGAHAVSLEGSGNTVQGNLIGTDASGTQALGYHHYGVLVCGADNLIGGPSPGARNVISGGNSAAINVDCEDFHMDPSPGTVIRGNYIGVDVSGTAPLPNLGFQGAAVIVYGDSVIGGTAPGEANVIAYTDYGAGIYVEAIVTIRGNSIHSNKGELGGDVGIRVDDFLAIPPPVIMTVSGSGASGSACGGCIVDVFSDDENEGRIFHGSATADPSGMWSFAGALVGPAVTATATNAAGSTSEFSAVALTGEADEDADGWTHDDELSIDTDPSDPCADTTTSNDEDPDPWPVDFDDNTFVNISDVLAIKPAFGSSGAGVSARHDIVVDGAVNIADVLRVKPHFAGGSTACFN